jgi:hypothetical protein
MDLDRQSACASDTTKLNGLIDISGQARNCLRPGFNDHGSLADEKARFFTGYDWGGADERGVWAVVFARG